MMSNVEELLELVKSLRAQADLEMVRASKFEFEFDRDDEAFYDGKASGLRDAADKLEKLIDEHFS